MKKMAAQKIIELYLESGAILFETTLNGDYKRGNLAAKKLAKPSEFIKKDKKLAAEVLSEVMKSDNDYTRSLAASFALDIEVMTEESIATLEGVAQRQDLIGFGAALALRRHENIVASVSKIIEGFEQRLSTVTISIQNTGLVHDQAQEIMTRAAAKFDNNQLPGRVEILTDRGTLSSEDVILASSNANPPKSPK